MHGKFDRILIADDLERNRLAAREAIPNADIVSSAAEAILKLHESDYDLVITDMMMEEEDSGLEVVNVALNEKSVISYVLSQEGSGHHGQVVIMMPYGDIIELEGGKSNPETWRSAINRIKIASGAQEAYHNAMIRRKRVTAQTKQDEDLPIIPNAVVKAIYYKRDQIPLRTGAYSDIKPQKSTSKT